jgi:DNA-binding GntR family transcriptional regulator
MATNKNPVDEYALLRDLILSEQVLPNERLVEMDYAERFGTNRSSIRKAFARLEQDGLIVIEPFRGAHVRRVTEAEAIEMYEVRGALEVLLARHAAERATDVDHKSLRALSQKLRDSLRSKDAIAVGKASRLLREDLWRISGHTTGASMLATLNTRLVRVWFRSIVVPGRSDAIVDELTAVVEAVCAGSSAKAATAMRRYHDGAISNLKHAIGLGRSSLPVLSR